MYKLNIILDQFRSGITEAYESLIDFIPQLLFAVIVFFIGHFFIQQLKKRVYRIVEVRSEEALTAEFTSHVVAFFIYVILLVFCFNILEFSSLISKIIAGAGLTAFIIGFALKDIGENFLSGIIMVFSKPFRTNDIIEIGGLTGKVIRISLRETVLKSLDGKDLYIPNSDILKKPLQNFTIDDLLRSNFTIRVPHSADVNEVIKDIQDIILSFDEVIKKRRPSVHVESFDERMVTLSAGYWYSLRGSRTMNNRLRSMIIIKVIDHLKSKGLISV